LVTNHSISSEPNVEQLFSYARCRRQAKDQRAGAEPPSFIEFNGRRQSGDVNEVALLLQSATQNYDLRQRPSAFHGVGINPTRGLHKISKSLLTHSGVLCDKLLSGFL